MMESPPCTGHSARGCKGDSKHDEMHSPIPKGQVGRAKVYVVQEQNKPKAVRVGLFCQCGVCPLMLLCCVPLDVKHDQLKVTRCAQGNCDSLCAIHVLGTLEIRESLVPVTREVGNEN